jgi:protein-tyrosine phosphatase
MMQKDKRYIAFVCTGNTCRSPMAEGIFNKLAEEKGIDVTAESFGLSTITGAPVSENSVKVCAEIALTFQN